MAELIEAVVRMNNRKTDMKQKVRKDHGMVIVVSNEPLTRIDRQPTAIVPNVSQKTNRYLDQ